MADTPEYMPIGGTLLSVEHPKDNQDVTIFRFSTGTLTHSYSEGTVYSEWTADSAYSTWSWEPAANG